MRFMKYVLALGVAVSLFQAGCAAAPVLLFHAVLPIPGSRPARQRFRAGHSRYAVRIRGHTAASPGIGDGFNDQPRNAAPRIGHVRGSPASFAPDCRDAASNRPWSS